MIVFETIRPVVDAARDVRIDDAAVDCWAKSVTQAELRPPAHDLLKHLPGDESQLANLVLLISALNFCFWSEDPIRIEWRGKMYERFNAMFISLMLAARYDPAWFDARYWLSVPRAELDQVLSGKGTLLMMDERERVVRETAQTLLERFDGQFMHAVESVNRRAWDLAVLLMANFESFRDVSRYGDLPVYFMKRAQICPIDLSIAWQSHDYAPMKNMESLSAFADYRLPQSLRHLGIVVLSDALAARIEAEEELPAGSAEEVEIRAATIEAVERMRHAAISAGKPAATWEIDWYLWITSHDPAIRVNHHRTRTVYY